MTHRRWHPFLSLLLLGAGILASGVADASSSTSAPRRVVTVKLVDSRFAPAAVKLPRGGKVRFVWAGQLPHNLLGPGVPRGYQAPRVRHRALNLRLSRRGRFRYYCSVHPGMETLVRVR